jgi:RNA polymerase sigma-70 factor (ECF subfamily)
MTAAERVAFTLHDVFRYSYAEVAEIVGRTPAACRQLASSARRRIRASQAPGAPTARQAGIVRAFKAAWAFSSLSPPPEQLPRPAIGPATPARLTSRR